MSILIWSKFNKNYNPNEEHAICKFPFKKECFIAKRMEQNSSGLTDTEKRLVVAKGEELGREKGINGHFNL